MKLFSVYLFNNTTSKNEFEALISDFFDLKLIKHNSDFTLGVNFSEALMVNINKLRLDFIVENPAMDDKITLQKTMSYIIENNLINCDSYHIENYTNESYIQ